MKNKDYITIHENGRKGILFLKRVSAVIIFTSGTHLFLDDSYRWIIEQVFKIK